MRRFTSSGTRSSKHRLPASIWKTGILLRAAINADKALFVSPRINTPVRLVLLEDLIRFGEDLAYLVAERIGLNAEMNIRRSYLQIADENIAEAFVIILARVHGYMLAVLVEDLHNET